MRIPLLGGAYQARSLIANAQRSVNLYPENNPQADSAPVPVTQYQAPGLDLLAAVEPAIFRCLYRASNGSLYGVVASSVFAISSSYDFVLLGTIGDLTTPVSMADNGLVIVLVDGTTSGYSIGLATNVFAQISDPAFYGADRVDYVDTFFLFNLPGTNQWYISPSNWIPGVAFDPLDIAAKTGYPDPLASLIVMHREIWLVGTLTSEIWYNSGAADFTFQQMPGAFIEHGCVAKYSLAKQDLSVYWLSQDEQGQALVIKGSNYQARRISTHAIEEQFRTYAVVSDAIGYVYQQGGHVFYVLTFPSADKTWVYDEATEQWHERAWMDPDGNLHRHRSNCASFAYGKNLVGDWQNGNLYAFDLDSYTDAGEPMVFIRAFPHVVDDGKRVVYSQFMADIEPGTDDGSLDGSSPAAPPVVSLRWSDDRGKSYGNAVEQSLGAGGQYLTSVQWRRLGLARDRVFELSWSTPTKTALNGAFIDVQSAGT